MRPGANPLEDVAGNCNHEGRHMRSLLPDSRPETFCCCCFFFRESRMYLTASSTTSCPLSGANWKTAVSSDKIRGIASRDKKGKKSRGRVRPADTICEEQLLISFNEELFSGWHAMNSFLFKAILIIDGYLLFFGLRFFAQRFYSIGASQRFLSCTCEIDGNSCIRLQIRTHP